jgi:hypothetical protein
MKRLFLIALAAWSSPSFAQGLAPIGGEPEEGETPTATALAVTVSGGVSLGLYEAGYLYLVTEALKRSERDLEVAVATGASAGSINSFATAVASCLPPNDEPAQDLGYALWMDIGLDQLLDPAKGSAVSMLHRDTIYARWGTAEATWRAGLPEDCDVRIGAPVTRFHPVDLPMSSGLHLSRQTLYFSFRIQGRGAGVPPLVTNVVDPAARVSQVLLPLGERPETAMDDLTLVRDVLLASAAFPLAFSPVPLQYCVLEPAEITGTDADRHCETPEEQAIFIDGGVFDNQPLGLATRLASGHPGVRHLYVDPGIRAWPLPRDDPGETAPVDFVGLLGGFAGGFITSARNSQLAYVAEENPEVLDHLLVGTNRFPPASGHLEAFLGFFDRKFRTFDFALGMYDAWSDLGAWDLITEADRAALLATAEQGDAWAPFACLVSVYDHGEPSEACAGPEREDFRILVQASLDHVYSDCRSADSPTGHRHCDAAREGALPPAVVASPYAHPQDALRRPDESRIDHHLRLLGDYGFHYEDLGLTRGQSHKGALAVARKLEDMLTAMGNQQPNPIQRGLLQLGGRVFSGQIAYQAPAHWGYVASGTLFELGASLQPTARIPWLRFNLAVQADGFLALFTRVRSDMAVRGAVGPEFELKPLSSSILVPTLALRGGYLLGGGDDFRLQDCTAERASNDGRNCSQPMIQAVGAVTVVERIRLQGEFDWFARTVPFDQRRFDVEAGLGFQF